MEKIPLAVYLNDGMMGGPTDHRSEDHALIYEWAVRVVADGITEEMGVACGIGEIILSVILMHP